jgi:hypothetical protein
MKPARLLIAACWLLALPPSCTDTIQLAGPSIEQGNPAVAGVVRDSSRDPAPGAHVRIYRIPDSADGATGLHPLSAFAVASTRADTHGVFRFFDLTAGSYSLEARSPDSASFAMKTPIDIQPSGARHITDTLVLKRPGSIMGAATRGGQPGQGSNAMLRDAFIQVRLKEIDRGATTGPDGGYRMNAIPDGIYTVLFYATDGFFTAWRDSVTVRAGKTTTLDTIVLERIPWDAPDKPRDLTARYDTAAATIALRWRPAQSALVRGYEIERIDSAWRTDTTFTTVDTAYTDSIAAQPDGALLYYVVRSVSESFMRSANEGPVTIRVSRRAPEKNILNPHGASQ